MSHSHSMAMVASFSLKWQICSYTPYMSDAHMNVESNKILAPAELVEQKKPNHELTSSRISGHSFKIFWRMKSGQYQTHREISDLPIKVEVTLYGCAFRCAHTHVILQLLWKYDKKVL